MTPSFTDDVVRTERAGKHGGFQMSANKEWQWRPAERNAPPLVELQELAEVLVEVAKKEDGYTPSPRATPPTEVAIVLRRDLEE